MKKLTALLLLLLVSVGVAFTVDSKTLSADDLGTIDLSQLLEEEVELRAIRGDKFNVTFRESIGHNTYFTLNAVVQQTGPREFIFYSVDEPVLRHNQGSREVVRVLHIYRDVSRDMKSVTVNLVEPRIFKGNVLSSTKYSGSTVFTFKAGFVPEA